MSLASWDTVHTYKQRHVGSSPRSHHLASTVYTPDFHLFYIFQPEWSDWESMGVLGVHFHRLWTSSSTFIGPKELCAILSSSQVVSEWVFGKRPLFFQIKGSLWSVMMMMRKVDEDEEWWCGCQCNGDREPKSERAVRGKGISPQLLKRRKQILVELFTNKTTCLFRLSRSSWLPI